MIGYRARLGFLLPPGNPAIDPDMIAMCPQGVSLHFNRMVARGGPARSTARPSATAGIGAEPSLLRSAMNA